ncbi:F-box/kelch-repeat protein At3g23880-like [Humulus lupulus]|uniref:F-box/kelch-repeat protein At3g23880-like n=1 Tax=Humulus lupulus TaxID=3486 RepID=UPI002B411743|nr:F-box/kelch-repeat protein At3g23880-like [Humulus lupulus]
MAMVVSNSKLKIRCWSDGCCKLPMEIIEEIVLRSDAKSVIRFKCVSRYWLSRLSEPSFMNAYHKRQVPRTLMGVHFTGWSVFLSGRGGCVDLFSVRISENFDQISSQVYSFERKASEMVFMGSDSGVICLRGRYDNSVYLWNPAIEKHKKLPRTPPPPSNLNLHIFLYGFGYEPLTNDFKVVAVGGGGERSGYGSMLCGNFFLKGEQVSVYSSKSDSWKTMVMPDLISSDQHDNHSTLMVVITSMGSVVVSDSIHWPIAIHRLTPRYEKLADDVVAFDLSSEEFKLIKAPSSLKNKGFINRSISNFCGCLSLNTSSLSCIEIWVMKKYGVWDSWTKYLYVDFANQTVPSSLRKHFRPHFRPLGVSHNGNLLLESRSLDVKNRYVLSFYDPKSRTVYYIGERESRYYFANYAESIFLG